MITVRTSPAYVNRVRQDWTANGGVYGDGGVYAVVPSNDPFAQLGPTLDLTFAGVPTDQFTAATTDGYSINLNLSSEIYQIAVEYAVWSGYQVNYALLPAALTEAALNTEPAKTLFKDTLIGGRPLGDINNDGSVTSADATAYQRFNGPFWLNTADRNDYIRTVLNPYMLANPGLYAAYLTPSTGLAQQTFAEIITFTRTGTGGTFFNSAGVLTAAAADQPRFDYDPSTLEARGLLIEEARTNSIRNNTMVGAVAGTPGTLPTNWSGVAPADNVNREIVGTGTQNGINYIDVKFNGTSGTATTVFLVLFESNTQVAASNGQTWSSSVFVSVVGGNTNNITALNIRQTFRDGAGASLQANDSSLLAATSSLNRFSVTATGANANIAFINSSIVANFADNSAVDITLRIGLPQLELGAFATSVIPTTTTALTRNADVANINTLAPWYNQVSGTVYAEFMNMVAGSATQTNGSQGVWGITQSALTGSFNGYALSTNLTAPNTASLNFRSRYQPTGKIDSVNVGVGYLAATTTYKTAAAWDSSQITADSDVGALATGTNNAAADMGTHDRMQLGAQNAGGTPPYQLNGWLRRITYYPRRLSNADLQTITT